MKSYKDILEENKRLKDELRSLTGCASCKYSVPSQDKYGTHYCEIGCCVLNSGRDHWKWRGET